LDSSQSWLDRLALLAKYRKFLLRWLLLWVVIGVIAAFTWPPRYQAVCSFLPPTEDNSGFMAGFGTQLKLGNVSDIEGQGFYVILHSKRVKDSLDQVYNFRSRYHDNELDKAYDDFDTHLDVSSEIEEVIGMSRIHAFYVKVSDKNPDDAAKMANSLIFYADRITAELTSQRQRLTREFLEKRVDASKESLRVAEDSLRAFSQRTGIVAPDVQIEATIKALGGIEEQIAATDVDLHIIATTLGPSHPNVKVTLAKKAELERQRDELSGKIDRTVSTNLIALKQTPELSLDYARLYRGMKTQELLETFLTQQLEQARLGELRDAPVLRVLDRAIPPQTRKWPIRSLVVIIAFFLGLFAGLVWIGWNEWRLAMVSTDFERRFFELLRLFSPKSLWRVMIGKE